MYTYIIRDMSLAWFVAFVVSGDDDVSDPVRGFFPFAPSPEKIIIRSRRRGRNGRTTRQTIFVRRPKRIVSRFGNTRPSAFGRPSNGAVADGKCKTRARPRGRVSSSWTTRRALSRSRKYQISCAETFSCNFINYFPTRSRCFLVVI